MKDLAGATAILCAALLAGVTAQPSQRYDLLITNGRVMDGTGNPWFPADVAVQKVRSACRPASNTTRAAEHHRGSRRAREELPAFNAIYISHERSEGSDPLWYVPSQDGPSAVTLLDAVRETIEAAKLVRSDIAYEIRRRGSAENITVYEYTEKPLYGKSLAEIARLWKLDPVETAIKIQLEGLENRNGGARMRGFWAFSPGLTKAGNFSHSNTVLVQ